MGKAHVEGDIIGENLHDCIAIGKFPEVILLHDKIVIQAFTIHPLVHEKFVLDKETHDTEFTDSNIPVT